MSDKLFYYPTSRKPLFLVKGDENDLCEDILAKYQRGISVSIQHNEIATAITELYGLYKKGELDAIFNLRSVQRGGAC